MTPLALTTISSNQTCPSHINTPLLISLSLSYLPLQPKPMHFSVAGESFWGFPMWNSAENLFARSGSFREGGDDEEALRWAALERLPTYARVQRGIFRNVVGDTMEIDVGELEAKEQRLLLDRLVSSAEDDPEQFFDRMRRRFDAVALNFPKIEVRFQNLKVEAFVHVGSRALPTIPNFVFNTTEV